MSDSREKKEAPESITDPVEAQDEAQLPPAAAEEAVAGADAENASEPEAAQSEEPPPPRRPSRLPLMLSILAILGLGAVTAVGYRLLQQEQQSIKQISAAVEQAEQARAGVRSKVTALGKELASQQSGTEDLQRMFEEQKMVLQEQGRRLEEARGALEKREAEMQAALKALHQRIGRSSTQWMAAEAEYLIRVANHRLRLERDAKTALAALQSADGRLQATGDPAWTEVREALATEMAALRTLAQQDKTGMVSALDALAQRVDKLRLTGAQPPVVAVGREEDKTTWMDGFSFEDLLQRGWEGFKSMVVIRYHDEPVTAMLPPEQRYFVYQNLRLQLETARLAVLRSDTDLYRSSLKTVREWIEEFVILEDAETQAMLGEIKNLAQVDVRPKLPDISGSLRLLRARMEQVAMESVVP